MKNNKTLILMIIIISVLVLGLTGTFAWYVWSGQDKNLVSYIETNVGAAQVFYDAGADIVGRDLKPVTDKSLGIVKKITVITKEETINDISFNLYLDVNEISNELKDQTFKYAVYDDSGNEVVIGNFADATLVDCKTNGVDHIVLIPSRIIDNTSTVYTLYIWIDGTVNNNPAMAGKNFNFTLHADGQNAVMRESINTNIIHNDVIPEGGTYITGAVFDEDTWEWDMSNITTYNAGDAFPDTVEYGDIYTYGDYEYRYGISWCYEDQMWSDGCYEDRDGWGVAVLDNSKDSYGDIVSVINSEDVTNLTCTFGGCEELVFAPNLPATIKYMDTAFCDCINLVETPKLPDGVITLGYAFAYNSSLLKISMLPNSVTNMNYTFFYCTGLTEAPVIPNSVTDMGGTFSGCTGLTEAPEIPNSVTSLFYTFYNCTSLVTAPVIPSSVTDMRYTFSGCTSLVTVPVIPNSVTNMYATFRGCTSLVTAPVIPSSVTSLYYTFYNCTSLTGTVRINSSSVTSVFYIFGGTSKAITVEVPAGSTTYNKLTVLTTSNGKPSNVTLTTFTTS